MEFLANNWLYLIFVSVMVFMMIKGGGCCGMSSHSEHSHDKHPQGGGCCGGGHSSDNHSKTNYEYNDHQNNVKQLDIEIDPICGMSVNPDTAIKQIVNGKTYYFCSESCRTEFLREQKQIQ